MSLRRLLVSSIAGAALASCAGIVSVSLLCALYDLFEGALGPAGACAAVCGLFAVLLALSGLIAVFALSPPVGRTSGGSTVPDVERALELLRDRPILWTSAAVGAGLLAVLQPGLAASAVRTFFQRRRAVRSRA